MSAHTVWASFHCCGETSWISSSLTPRRSIFETPMPFFWSSALMVSPVRGDLRPDGLVHVHAEHEVEAALEVETEIDGLLRRVEQPRADGDD